MSYTDRHHTDDPPQRPCDEDDCPNIATDFDAWGYWCGEHNGGRSDAPGPEDDANDRVASEEGRALGTAGLRGLDRGADGPAAPSAEAVEELDFVQVGHTPKSDSTPRLLTGGCESCGGEGFLAGAHTERVNPCPACGGVLGYCPHGVDLDRYFCSHGCRV